jgi:hypothetical protein
MPEYDGIEALWRARDPAATGVAPRLRWHVNRLRCMTHAEIGHRVLRALKTRA